MIEQSCAISIVCISVLVISCETRKDIEQEQNYKMLTWSESEVQLQQLYQKVELHIRLNLGVTDQEKIDKMIQLLIDDGEVGRPFVVKKDKNGRPEIFHLSYVEYKKYRSENEIDTVDAYTIYIDSTIQPVELDSSILVDPRIRQLEVDTSDID